MRIGLALAVLAPGLALLPSSAPSAEKAYKQADAGPVSVQARYRLRYNSIEVGKLEVNTSTNGASYTLSGAAKVSVLFGAFKWSGSSNVSGALEAGKPAPATYAFNWQQNKKGGTVNMGYRNHVPADVAVQPPPKIKPDTVPVTEAHKAGALDPMSAVLVLTKADGRPPCDRRVPIFDGKQRYDVVLTPKRTVQLASALGGAGSENAFVCRLMYEPVAGHRNNEDTKAYASNRDAELVLRRIPGTEMLIPYSITIPTTWGTGTMVTDRIDIVTANAGKIALTN